MRLEVGDLSVEINKCTYNPKHDLWIVYAKDERAPRDVEVQIAGTGLTLEAAFKSLFQTLRGRNPYVSEDHA